MRTRLLCGVGAGGEPPRLPDYAFIYFPSSLSTASKNSIRRAFSFSGNVKFCPPIVTFDSLLNRALKVTDDLAILINNLAEYVAPNIPESL